MGAGRLVFGQDRCPDGRLNGTALTAATVSDDGLRDTLAGKKGGDWFIVGATDKVADLDLKVPEVETVL